MSNKRSRNTGLILSGLRPLPKPPRARTPILALDGWFSKNRIVATGQEGQGDCDGRMISELARDAGVNVFRRFAFMKGLYEVEQVSFDRMVDPTDDSRLHEATGPRSVWRGR